MKAIDPDEFFSSVEARQCPEPPLACIPTKSRAQRREIEAEMIDVYEPPRARLVAPTSNMAKLFAHIVNGGFPRALGRRIV